MVFVPIIGISTQTVGTGVLNVNHVQEQVKIVVVQKHDGWFLMGNFQQMVPIM